MSEIKIYYGYNKQNYADITSKVKEITNFHIPAEDESRAFLFGDPFPGIVKHILIVINNIEYKIYSGQECLLNPQTLFLNIIHPKTWWDNEGKDIADKKIALSSLHRKIAMEYGKMSDEYPEQLLTISFIQSQNKVLEIGGNIGRNSLILSTILNNTDNLVVLESDINIVPKLKHNLDLNKYYPKVEPRALSSVKLLQKGWDTLPENLVKDKTGWKEVSIISFSELQAKYNIIFDTIVADCEGALYYILQNTPEILDNINMLIVENDYPEINHKNYVDSILIQKRFNRVYYKEGGWGPCYNFFYEVWKK